jgi:hypothetical protein
MNSEFIMRAIIHFVVQIEGISAKMALNNGAGVIGTPFSAKIPPLRGYHLHIDLPFQGAQF